MDSKAQKVHGLCHGNCRLCYIEEFLELRKFIFRRLKWQFDVKKANFRGLTTKIDCLRLILTSKTHLWPIFMDYAMETMAFVILKGF